jgi:hypothetical protein
MSSEGPRAERQPIAPSPESEEFIAPAGGISSGRMFESLAEPGYRWYLLSMLG